MIIDKEYADDIMDFPTIPMKDSAVKSRYMLDGMEIRYHRGPELRGDDVMIFTPYAVTVHYKDKCIFSASIEEDDLRSLSSMLGESIKELQAEYGVRGFYGKPMISLYGNGEKESLGHYLGSENEDDVISFLLSLVYDTFDTVSDAELITD